MTITAIIPAHLPEVDDRAVDRFSAKVEVDETSGCWRWKAAIGRWGYGQFWWGGKVGYAHVFAHIAFVGPVPSGYEVDHVRERGCLHRDCVNPAHLEAVTKRENTLRGEGVSAQAARKTHCPKGHPYEGDNLWVEPGSGTRRCVTCVRAKNRAGYLRRSGR